ncbi:hypothetical protein K1T71_011095 [Dendrolimus kikuchii]|uniref:Uncharacterized protein n=1 Tax=Dendrolimus kikuchii TaxID=765133 RepID=A0ACC1CMV1_9NEOP|nr:hypothetical protein K1T71_011095 [Dendrolimus kikuchii]
MYVLEILLTIIGLLIIFIYYISKRKFNYWKKRNVPYVKPTLLFGNYRDHILMKKYSGQVAQKLCQQFPNEPYFGSFYGTEPALVVQSPNILKHVFTKDFYYFHGREVSAHSKNEKLTRNMFSASGDDWKVVRQNLTPLFSSAKMKAMFPLIEKCSKDFEDMLDYETSISKVLEARSIMIRFTMDCICSCAFGVETNTMARDSENNIFTSMGRLIFSNSLYRGYKLVGRAIWPSIFYKLGFKAFPDDIMNFFSKLLFGVFEERNYKPSGRNDFIDQVLMFKENNYIVGDCISNMKTGEKKKTKLKVDNDLLAAQCVLFFGAGFDSSASTLSCALYELAKNPEAQKKAQQEVDEYLRKNNNKLDYECVSEMPYLEACLLESSRMYPVFGILTREVMDDYTFPDGLQLDKGVRVHIPVFSIHYNPDYFPDPETYRPERFLTKDEIKPYTFFPFGEGPRICIGMRFAKMQTIAGLITFLKKYNVELADDMPAKVEFEPTTFLTVPTGGLNLKVTPREGWERRMYAR